MWLAATTPTMEPALMPRIRKPMSCVLAPSRSRTAGTRLAQVANTKPQRAKMVKTALRHWISSRDGLVLVMGIGT